MIKKVSDILSAFAAEERKKLDEYQIEHGPTIGSMYEGLSRKVLKHAIPEGLGLRIVEGFASFADELSGQIDCMLVRGEGEIIPYTDSHKWPIQDIIAVFEVKKNFSKDKFDDSYFHLKEIDDLHTKFIANLNPQLDLTSPRRIFSKITGIEPPPHTKIDQLDFDKQMIYHTIVSEFFSPIRIIVSHHGWKKESTLREHVWKFLSVKKDNLTGLGVGSFPHLIVAGDFSLAKANGSPYITHLVDGDLMDNMWPFLISLRENPVKIILELIWTRLDVMYELGDLWGDDQENEIAAACLLAKCIKKGDKAGWAYEFVPIKESHLKSLSKSDTWEPIEVTDIQTEVLCALGEKGSLSITNEEFIKAAVAESGDVETFLETLLSTGLVALGDESLHFTTELCQIVITPDGKSFAAENNSGRLTTWLNSFLERRKKKQRSNGNLD